MKNLVKTNLSSKNNVKNGFYLYCPIVEINGEYFYCESIKTKQPVKTFNSDELKITRQIPNEFLKANGIY